MHGSNVYDAAIFEYCASPREPVQRDLKRRARKVEHAAKAMAGIETGRLRRSIKSEVIPGLRGIPQIRVGSSVGYAELHHEGTRPHVILPHMRHRLRFKIHGRVIYATQVFHPGTRPNHYLTTPLRLYAGGS